MTKRKAILAFQILQNFCNSIWHLHIWFTGRDPSLLYLARYPLQVVAREWVNCISVMSHSVKQYEYDSKDFRDNSIEIDLKKVHRWRRRTMASEQKTETCMRFIQNSWPIMSRGNKR
ncbi:hypothetical protein PMIN06_009705 [Paraphaeosphaeria minitans]